MNDPIVLTTAEIAYLTSAWPQAVADRVHRALGIQGERDENVLLAGLGSLLERGLVIEAESEAGYAPSIEAKVAMLGMYGAQATIEFATIADRQLHALTIFVGPELRLGALAAAAGRYQVGLYPTDVDWLQVLVDGIQAALRSAPGAICLIQFRSAAEVLERLAIRSTAADGWSIADSADADAAFQPTTSEHLRRRIAAALTAIDLAAPVAG